MGRRDLEDGRKYLSLKNHNLDPRVKKLPSNPPSPLLATLFTSYNQLMTSSQHPLHLLLRPSASRMYSCGKRVKLWSLRGLYKTNCTISLKQCMLFTLPLKLTFALFNSISNHYLWECFYVLSI